MIVRNGLNVRKDQEDYLTGYLTKRGMRHQQMQLLFRILVAVGSSNHAVWTATTLLLKEVANKFPWFAESPQGAALGRPATFSSFFSANSTMLQMLGYDDSQGPDHCMMLSLLQHSGSSTGHLALRDVAILAIIAACHDDSEDVDWQTDLSAIARIAGATDEAIVRAISRLTFDCPSSVLSQWRSVMDEHATLSTDTRRSLLSLARIVRRAWPLPPKEPLPSPLGPDPCVGSAAVSDECAASMELPNSSGSLIAAAQGGETEPHVTGDSDTSIASSKAPARRRKSTKEERKEHGFGKIAGKRIRVRELPSKAQLLNVPQKPSDPEDKGERRQPEDYRNAQYILAAPSPSTAKIEVARPLVGERMAICDFRADKCWLADTDRWNVLTPEETKHALKAAFDHAEQAKSDIDVGGDIEHAKGELRATLELVLIALAAISDKSVAEVQFATRKHALAASNAVSVTWDGELIRKIPSVKGRFKPKPEEMEYLRPVQEMVILRLPLEGVRLLRAWIKVEKLDEARGPVKLFTERVAGSRRLSPLCEMLANRSGVHRLAAGRLRDVLPFDVFRVTTDVTIAQFVSGRALRLSPVGGSYYTARLCELQTVYDQFVRRIGLTPAAAMTAGLDVLIGSKLSMNDEYVHQRIAGMGNGLNRSTAMLRSPIAKIVDCHNRMVAYVGGMLEAAMATRSAGTVGDIRMRDMCLASGLIEISDKDVDAGHSVRRLVLCPMVVEQIRAFRAHLYTLQTMERLPHHIRAYATCALSGEGPLIALVNQAKDIYRYERKALKRFFPALVVLPGNAFRHRAATKLRAMGCRGDLVASQLGHLEFAQVFGIDSPTCPRDHDKVIGQSVDASLKSDGWKIVRGLGQEAVADPVPGRLSLDMKAVEEDVARREKNRRPDRSPAWHRRREKELSSIEEEITQLLERHAPDFPVVHGVRHINGECLGTMRNIIATQHTEDADSREWRFDLLHRQMMAGERQGRWVCEDRRRVFRLYTEPSPFARGMLEEHAKILGLRRWFCEALPHAMIGHVDQDSLVHWFLLGLILFDFVVETRELEAYAKAVPGAWRSKKHGDALFLSIQMDKETTLQTIQLTGVNAALAARLCGNDFGASESIIQDFEGWLSRTLPALMKPERGHVLPCLLLAARISSRFELPGTLRALRNQTLKAVSLRPERMLALVDDLAGGDGLMPAKSPDFHEGKTVEAPACSEAESRTLRLALAAILRPGRKRYEQITAKVGRTAKGDVVQTMEEKLTAFKERVKSTSELFYFLASYALRLLTRGTGNSGPLKRSSVEKYVCWIAKYLSKYGPGNAYCAMDEDAFINLYDAIAGSVEESTEAGLRACLWYFHSYIQSYHQVVRLDAAEVLGGHPIPANVDANVITEAEYRKALDAFANDIRAAVRRGDDEAANYLKAARVTLILMRRSGSRLGEVMGRRTKDLFLGEECSVIVLRASKFGTLKTISALRAVNMHQDMTQEERVIVWRWIEEREGLCGSNDRRNWSLFATGRADTPLLERHRITALLSEKLRMATGLYEARPHWLRHSATCTDFNALYEPVRDAEGCIIPDVAVALRVGGVGAGPLHLGEQVSLRARRGHRHLATTIASYSHTFILAMGHGSAWSRLAFSDRQMAAICGLTYAHVRKLRERFRRKKYRDQHLGMLLLQRSGVPYGDHLK
ncbi:site-specific integrase [Dyella humicola]|uniref:site-specific integrase n=1 Tax=Dyella humicola TaxID=2992126 RepID=UPI002257AE7B|nr:site-specific integrase [Dyella humicola]